MVSCPLPWKVIVRVLLETDLTFCRHLCTYLDISNPVPPSLFSVAELYTITQFWSSDHISSVGEDVIRQCSCITTMYIPVSAHPVKSWWDGPCWCNVHTLYVDIISLLNASDVFRFTVLFDRCVTKEVVISVVEICDYRGHCSSLSTFKNVGLYLIIVC